MGCTHLGGGCRLTGTLPSGSSNEEILASGLNGRVTLGRGKCWVRLLRIVPSAGTMGTWGPELETEKWVSGGQVVPLWAPREARDQAATGSVPLKGHYMLLWA